MSFDYGFGELGNELVDECRNYPPDFEKIYALLNGGVDLNVVDEEYDENILATIIYGYPEINELRDSYCESCKGEDCNVCSLNVSDADGRFLPEIVRMILEHGFDCSNLNGKAGLSCLQNLTGSSHDKYILDAAKLLLDYGVDPEGSTEPPETVMEWVYAKAVADVVIHNNIKEANLFFTMYEILKAKVKGEDYALIDYYDRCIGKPIDQVVLYGDNIDFKEIDESLCHYHGTLVFWCEGIPLCITEDQELYIHPNIPLKALQSKVVDDYFKECVGSMITAIEFDSDIIDQCACQQTILKMNNGTVIKFQFNAGEVPMEKLKNYCKVISANK